MPPPPLSVLLPVRNAEAHLPEALDSLAAQTFGDFEVLAVDDGSDDGSGEILGNAARRDRRIQVLVQESRGIVTALELARSRARGRWLARMDADDRALPQRFALQMEAMQGEKPPTVCGTGVAYFPPGAVREGALRYEAWINGLQTQEDVVRDLFVECPLPHPTLMMSARALEIVGGYRDRGWPEDYDLVLRLWEAGARFHKVPEVLLHWRESETRLSRRHAAYSDESFRRCKVHFLLRSHLSPSRELVIWGAGPVGKAFAREVKRQGGAVRAFVDLDPRKIGQVIHGAPVIRPSEIEDYRGTFCVAAVGQPGAREEIRAALEAAGWKEMEDFVAVA